MERSRALDALEAQLDALDQGAQTSPCGSVEEIAAALQEQVAEAIRATQDSVPLSSLAARADENLELARLAGSHQGNSGSAAPFYLRRVIAHLRELDRELLTDTREADRRNNRRDFISG